MSDFNRFASRVRGHISRTWPAHEPEELQSPEVTAAIRSHWEQGFFGTEHDLAMTIAYEELGLEVDQVSYSISDFKVGDHVSFWSERVFGVPVHATVTKVGRKLLHVQAQHWGVTWTTKVTPARVNAKEDR